MRHRPNIRPLVRLFSISKFPGLKSQGKQGIPMSLIEIVKFGVCLIDSVLRKCLTYIFFFSYVSVSLSWDWEISSKRATSAKKGVCPKLSQPQCALRLKFPENLYYILEHVSRYTAGSGITVRYKIIKAPRTKTSHVLSIHRFRWM